MHPDTDTTHYAFYPIAPEMMVLHEHYKKLKNTFWVPSEIDYRNDRDDWDTLTEDVRTYVKQILFLFAQLDGIVNENLISNFQKDTSHIKEAQHFYIMQGANELIHNETYSELIETFIRDPVERARGMDSIRNFPEIREVANWAFKWMDGSLPVLERIIAFACIEGVIFSSAFAGIYFIKRMNKLNGLTLANEWIARDEGVHTQFAVDLYHIMKSGSTEVGSVSQERAEEIVRSAVSVCENFTRNAMNVHLVGLNADDMVKYVEVTADWVLDAFGFKKYYNTVNPLEWMAVISLVNKSNFFEKKVTEYIRPSGNERAFDLNVDF